MLTKVGVSGFRSLDQFSIDIRPGLNVLVGPNGGGKTNILSLFSFVSAVSGDELGNAINSSGGVSKVFQKISKTSFVKQIEMTITGDMSYNRTLYLPPDYEKRFMAAGFIAVKYEWSFTIDSNLGYDESFFSHQKLKVKIITKSLFDKLAKDWDFEIEANADNPSNFSLSEEVRNEEMATLVRHRPRQKEDLAFFIDDLMDEYSTTLPIFYAVSGAYLLRRLASDLRSGSTFNFDPAVCKQSNDSAQSPSLEKNGNGLAATVYAIQKSSNSQKSPLIYSPRARFGKRVGRNLQEYFSLVNPAITGVNARNNPFDNKVTVNITVARGESSIDFPLELASDGTVKWLAFTVALLTEDQGFAIEEPENFLHPDIQRNAIELVRSETEGSENLFVLMTTHSETLLNAARPEELVVVSMVDGITDARRLDNAELIDEEMQRTGFGLGYYYISGALND